MNKIKYLITIALVVLFTSVTVLPSPIANAKFYKNRTQSYDSRTGNWIKRDTTNGRFMDQKTSSPDKFKNVRISRNHR